MVRSSLVPLVKLPEDPPPVGVGGWLPCFLQLMLPEQFRPTVGQQNIERRVIRDSVALLYRTDRPLQMRLSVIQLHPHPRADRPACNSIDLIPSIQVFSRHPSWACRAVGSARDDRLYPPGECVALLRQW